MKPKQKILQILWKMQFEMCAQDAVIIKTNYKRLIKKTLQTPTNIQKEIILKKK